MIPENPSMPVALGLFAIFGVVLLGPFLVKRIEHNLEVFLFLMGVAAITLDHVLLGGGVNSSEEVSASWNPTLIRKALKDPIAITLAVLTAGLVFHYARGRLEDLLRWAHRRFSLGGLVFVIIVALGLLSSVVTAIIAALLLVEITGALALGRKAEVRFVVLGCFAIGLGAALTPVGEPLSTIVIKTKLEESFWFLLAQIGKYIVPGIVVLGLLGRAMVKQANDAPAPVPVEQRERLVGVVTRALKVYVFVMALVFLGLGFTPIILWYIKGLGPGVLYWVNIVSAILDNATLASAEIAKGMSALQINAALMGLLIAGGMLVPGNIPNIVSANKLGIRSKEWARVGAPLGMAIMVAYFAVIFFLKL